METITDIKKIDQMIKEKQALETALAFDLLEIFDDYSTGLRGILQSMSGFIIDLMGILSNNQYTNIQFYYKWLSDWSGYGVAKKHALPRIWNHNIMKQRYFNFDAQDCGDMIRIWGECLENPVFSIEVWNRQRLEAQKGPKYFWTKFVKEIEESKTEITGATNQVVGKGNTTYNEVGRQRFVRKKLPQQKQNYTLDETEAWRMLSTMPFSGIKKWKIAESDPLQKMNKVFGLMPGATISGTTSDNISYMKLYQRVTEFHPIMYLLPLATIVSGGHHSFLEVAYVLSLNNIIDYRVGLYTSLFPVIRFTNQVIAPKGANEIKNLLKKYENHHWNHLMLISYRRPGIPKECIKFHNGRLFRGVKHAADLSIWKQLSFAKVPLLNKFRYLKSWPSDSDISRSFL